MLFISMIRKPQPLLLYFILPVFSEVYSLVPQVREPASEIIKAEIGESLSVTCFEKYGVFKFKCLLFKFTKVGSNQYLNCVEENLHSNSKIILVTKTLGVPQ